MHNKKVEKMIKDNAIVITNPMIAGNRSSEVTLSKFLRVMNSAFDKIKVIGGNVVVEEDLKNIEVRSFKIKRTNNKLKKIVELIILQIKMFFEVIMSTHKDEDVFFWIGDKMVLPFLGCKIRCARIHYFIYGNVFKEGNKSFLSTFSGRLICYMANRADFVCLESSSVIDEWENKIKNKEEIIHLYTDDIQLNEFKERKNIIGMICRLTEGKRVIESILAFIEFHMENPEWQCEIIGSGKQEKMCHEIIKDYNAEEFIHLLGWVEHDKLKDITSKWKILLFPTDTEGMPNGLLEMMGQGIPAIASPVGGIKDLLADGENGWVLAKNDSKSIYMALKQATTDAGYERISLNALKKIEQNYSLRAAKKHVEELFRNEKI